LEGRSRKSLKVKVLAPAKVNVFLPVGPRRPDGLHNLRSVMQSVSLCDAITIERSPTLTVDVVPAGGAPRDDSNLAVRAAQIFPTFDSEHRVAISIEKQIPMSAGLGGGSADAAATLVGLNRLWVGRRSRKALEEIAADLGADVPFCIRGGTAVASGTGANLSTVPCPKPIWWVVGISGAQLSTADVYREFDRLGGGELEDCSTVIDALAHGDTQRLASSIKNNLERAAISLAPQIEVGRDSLVAAGALRVILAGSGPTWLGLARDERHAFLVAERGRGAFKKVRVAHSLVARPRRLAATEL